MCLLVSVENQSREVYSALNAVLGSARRLDLQHFPVVSPEDSLSGSTGFSGETAENFLKSLAIQLCLRLEA
jgi:hypothetical protein